LYSNLQTRPLVREGATNSQNRKCLKEISRREKNWSQVPDGRLTPGQTGRLTVGRKLTHSLTHKSSSETLPLLEEAYGKPVMKETHITASINVFVMGTKQLVSSSQQHTYTSFDCGQKVLCQTQ
jgi:hypothetical protein